MDGAINQTVSGLTGSGAVVGSFAGEDSILEVDLSSGSNTFSGTLGGSSGNQNKLSLAKSGAGTLVLAGSSANTFTGLTNVAGGVLSLASSSGNAIGGDLHIDSGAVEITASNQIVNTSAVSMMGGSFGFTGSGLTETVGSVSNSGGSFSTGANTLIASGGAVNLSGGSSTVSAGGTLQGASGLQFEGTASPVLTLESSAGQAGRLLLGGDVSVLSTLTAGTAQIVSGGSATNQGYVDMGGVSRSFTVNNGSAANDLQIAVPLTNGSLTKAGAGTLTLSGSGANTFTGVATVNAGVLQLAKNASVVAVAGNVAVNNGGTLQILASNQLSSTAQIVVASGGTLNFGSATGLTNSFGTFTNSGTFSSGANTFSGTGSTITWTGSSVNTVNSSGVVEDRHLVIDNATGTNTIQAGGTLRLLVAGTAPNGLYLTGAALDLESSNGTAGLLEIRGDIVASGSTTINSTGSLSNAGQVNLQGATRSVTVDSGGTMLVGALVTNGGLSKAGAGTLTLSGANSYAGTTSVTEGVLRVTSAGGLGTTAGGTVVSSGASLQVSGGAAVGAEPLGLSGGGAGGGSGALNSVSGDNSWAGDVTLSAASRINVDAGSLALTGAFSGSFGLTVGGPGRLKLSGATNGTTTTNVDGGATLQIGDGGTTGRLGSGEVTLSSGSVLEFKWLSGTAVSVGNVIGGAGSVTANGGTITISGADTYTGATTITSGTLEVTGTGQLSGTSSVVIAGGTLLLSGSSSDRINNAAGVTLGGGSGANSVVELSGTVSETLGALTLTSGGGFRVIDFGSGSGVLTFGSLSSGSAGVPLQIWNWTGNVWTGGGTDQLKITSGTLGSNISLSDITIFSDSGITTVRTGEVAWSGGELVAIPEARSLLGGLLLLMPLAWRERRQWWRGAAARLRG